METSTVPNAPHFGRTLDGDGRPVLFSCETMVRNVDGTPVSTPLFGQRFPIEEVGVGDWIFTGHGFWRVTVAPRSWRNRTQVSTTERSANRFVPGTLVWVVSNPEAEDLAVTW